jgi:hypothetical protein
VAKFLTDVHVAMPVPPAAPAPRKEECCALAGAGEPCNWPSSAKRKGSVEMTIRIGSIAGLVLALGLILCASNAQAATRYGVNRTIDRDIFVNECTTTLFNCIDHCSDVLAAACQQDAPSFCDVGDKFVSASLGGVYPEPATHCDVTSSTINIFCDPGLFYNNGPGHCSGSCNALCEDTYTPLPCDCFYPGDCDLVYGPPPSGGTWACANYCYCIPNLSPLVLYLPDYGSAGGGNQSWWKRGFCGPETPTVCLDWAGDGSSTCTAWLEPGSGIAFVVALSDVDMFQLLDWKPIAAEPSRHFFGNVTMGPEGDHPYANGFEALAARCGQDPNSDLDLTECGASLFAWEDRDSDGLIEVQGLLEFQDLGITALSDPRTTGKKDKCGNAFRVESNAICGQGRCGTVLDVYFQPR